MWINEIVNHPDVFPLVAADQKYPLDVQPLLDLPGTIVLRYGHGGFILLRKDVGVYEAHVFFTPKGWGLHAVKAGRDMLARVEARLIYGECPRESRVGRYCRAIGMSWDGKRYVKCRLGSH